MKSILNELAKPANAINVPKVIGWFKAHPRIESFRETTHTVCFLFDGKSYLVNRHYKSTSRLHPKGLKTLKQLYTLLETKSN